MDRTLMHFGLPYWDFVPRRNGTGQGCDRWGSIHLAHIKNPIQNESFAYHMAFWFKAIN